MWRFSISSSDITRSGSHGRGGTSGNGFSRFFFFCDCLQHSHLGVSVEGYIEEFAGAVVLAEE
jgi:hypothetical protein